MANQEPARAVGRHFRQEAQAMLFVPGSEKLARVGMVEWNRIFRLFRFSGILGQPREVHPKFRNEIPENVCSIRSPTRNFRNFWSNGKRPWSLEIDYSRAPCLGADQKARGLWERDCCFPTGTHV